MKCSSIKVLRKYYGRYFLCFLFRKLNIPFDNYSFSILTPQLAFRLSE